MKRWLDYWRSVRARIVLDRGFARALWVVPWLVVKALGRRRKPILKLAYHPQPAGPWYTLPLALIGTGVRTVRRVEDADAVMVFDDRTAGETALVPHDIPQLNARITDISKSHVGAVFERVFGYALSVDPTQHVGPMVEKSDANGVHDGRIVEGPLERPAPSMAYQRLIDTTARTKRCGEVMSELRCTCVGGRVVAVVRKLKSPDARFAARYLQTDPVDPLDVIRPAEHARIADFLNAMGLDFGSIDLLRDGVDDDRLYIVDVNKTCMPVLSMDVRQLDPVMATIGDAAEALIRERVRESGATPPK